MHGILLHGMAWQLYVEDDRDKSPTQEELEMLLRAAGVGAGVSTSRTGGREFHLADTNPFLFDTSTIQ